MTAMSRGPVVIEVTRGPVVESRHEGIAAVVKADGTVVEAWGDIDAAILPRSANKPIQAMAFVESGAVERFGLGNEHIALACALGYLDLRFGGDWRQTHPALVRWLDGFAAANPAFVKTRPPV